MAKARCGSIFVAEEIAMPLPHFLAIVLAVIAAAGATLWAVQALDLPLIWAALGALVLAAAVRGLAWR